MGARLDITDNRTGSTVTFYDETFDPDPDSGSEYNWTEGNFSCDCNRAIAFGSSADEVANVRDCGEDRFTVLTAVCDDGKIITIDSEEQD